MQGDGSAATVMLGLDGFVLLAVSEYAGELEQAIETTAAEVFCRGCGVQARLHDRRPSWVRDLPSGGRPVTLVWVKRVWRCMERSCPTSTWTETSQNIRARACLTERARREICRRVGEEGHSVAEVARDFGVGWGTAMAAVAEYGQPLVDDPDRLGAVSAVGVDETAFLAANAAHHTMFVTGVVDVRPGQRRGPRLLDLVPGRSGTALSALVLSQPTGVARRDRGGPRWTRSAVTRTRCAQPFLRRRWCWTPSTWSGWGSQPLTTSAAASNRNRPVTVVDATTRCIASVGCCAAAPTT